MMYYDPIKKGEYVEKHVCRDNGDSVSRKYYRFRGGSWYGGIASGDVIGCNLACKFCWAWRFRDRYDLGEYFSPKEAYMRLKRIAVRKGYKLLRLTGGEPTLCVDHLLSLIDLSLRDNYRFIVETNGLLIGSRPWIAEELAKREGVIVRVSFKGVSSSEFAELTGAIPDGFGLQLKGIKNLLSAGLRPCSEIIPAIMVSFSDDRDIATFVAELADLDPALASCIDWEVVILYPHVERFLRRYGLKPKRFVRP
ncbi:MAG: radical SAM protein [Desulfurococcales archaeon]|nr:radical SAM protein [Desulfurococcales archaeon]